MRGFDEDNYCNSADVAINNLFYGENITTIYYRAVVPEVPDTLIDDWLAKIQQTSRSEALQ